MVTCIADVFIRDGMIVTYKNVHVYHTPLLWSGESSRMYRLNWEGGICMYYVLF